MKISIFLSTYNRKNKLCRAISSILDQKYEDWELLIVDDGSTDQTEEMIADFGSSKIKYTKFKENRGHPVAIFESKIINELTGDLVVFFGADDYFTENAFQAIINTFNHQPESVWKVGFLWKCESDLNKTPNKLNVFQDQTKYISNEIMSDRYVQSDYLFVYRRIFWKKFQTYFSHSDNFFTSFYDVAMTNLYIEIITKEYVMIAGWSDDNITKGNNSQIYFNWSTITRKYLYDQYSSNMSRKYMNYSIRSLIGNLLVSKGSRMDALKYFFIATSYQVNDLIKTLILIPAFFFPFSMLHRVKKILFSMRRRR